MLRDLAEQPEGCGRFRLGEHVDLKIEVRAAVASLVMRLSGY